jgi:murein DD-endopeptidase MepM/ murein hydrolase activator NlpD
MLRRIAIGMTGVVLSLVGAVVMSSGTGCSAAPVDVDQVASMDAKVAGYEGDQLVNAAIIMNVATARGLGNTGQIIGVSTAIAQSELRNMTASEGSTELGLFAQSGQWGSAEERLDPTKAALLFFAQLERVPNWQTSTPAVVATQVTGDGDADHTSALQPASEIVEALSRKSARQGCASGGWITPVDGHRTSPFGWRMLRGAQDLHTGTDLAAPCGTSVSAASPGVVIFAGEGWNGGAGNQIRIDHGGGIHSHYGHLLTGSISVDVGDQVMAGIPIAEVGTTGNSTGCHLHFEIQIDRTPVDAETFYRDRGLVLVG